MKRLGIDLGGTHIRGALVSDEGKVINWEKIPTGLNRSPNSILNLLQSFIENKIDSLTQAIGIGFPGIVNSKESIVYSSPHYPEWKNWNLKNELKLSLPFIIDNDVNMQAEAEILQNPDWENFLLVSIGTGIGGALVYQKKIITGDFGFTGEWGHMLFEKNGRSCACGAKGCWEAYVSATAIRQQCSLPGDPLPVLSELFKKGDSHSYVLFKEFGENLGIGLASLVNVTGITRILLGGGLSYWADLYLPFVKEAFQSQTYPKNAEEFQIRVSSLKDEAGVLGAALRARAFLI